MKMIKQPVSILLVMTMIVSLFTVIPFEVNAKVKNNFYRYYLINEWTQKREEHQAWLYDTKSIGTVTDGGVMSGNYISDYGLIQFRQRVTVSGEVNIILADNSIAWFYEGIRVPEGSTLNIYIPDGAVGNGKVVAYATKCDYLAGIGSNDRDEGAESGAGDVNIHGGNIIAYGGSDAAGIGGGNEAHGGHVTVYNGYVEAYGGTDAAGIGSGDEYSGSFRGSVTVWGGTVKATAGEYGAGIGGGDNVGNIDVNIYGGDVTAKASYHGAGIGGGEHADSGNITIKNAAVTAVGGKDGAAGIGGGYKGTNGEITIIDSSVNAQNSDKYLNSDKKMLVSGQGAAIGSGFTKNQVGAITIRNSTVDVQAGCFLDGDGGGAGIGSGQEGDAGAINIYDSEVTAFAVCGAGIGGGDGGTSVTHPGGDGGTINIERSTVVAVSSARGAGIGGGDEGDGGTVTITDSEVYAVGGGSQYLPSNLVKPAVTATMFESTYYFVEALMFTSTLGGAGIGGGDGGDGGNVVIKNSSVYAQTRQSGSSEAIGYGKGGSSEGTLTIDDDAKVDYGNIEKKDDTYQFKVGGTAPGSGRLSACRNKKCVRLIKCNHNNAHYTGIPAGHYIDSCPDCESSLEDLRLFTHSFGEDKKCIVCGHDGVQITYDTGNFEGTMEPIMVGKGLSYQLPDTVPFSTSSLGTQYAVSKWRIEGTDYKVGQSYTVDHDVTMLALYDIASKVVIINSSHGTVTSDKLFGAPGTSITLTAAPDDDCYLKQICVKAYDEVIYEKTAANGESLALEHQFTLPDSGNVAVYSVFEQNKYRITGDASDFNAVMEVRVNDEPADAAALGDTVSVSVAPQNGAESIYWIEVDETGSPIGDKHWFSLEDGKASFTMSTKKDIAIIADNNHRHHFGSFFPWGTTEFERTHLPLPGNTATNATYYLVSDIELSGTAYLKKDLYICLNGHTISASDDFTQSYPLIEMSGCSMTIYDHDDTGAIDGSGRCRLFDLNNAELEIYGGTLKGGSKNTGSAVNFTRYNNTFIMHGGVITQNTGIQNGVIQATGSGKVIIDGGKITDNGAPAALYIGPSIDFQISGSPYISGNHTSIGGKIDRNVLFQGFNLIKITGKLSEDALIGIHSTDHPNDDGFFARTEGLDGRGTALNFSCDDSDIAIGTLDGEAVFGTPVTVTFDMGNDVDTVMPPVKTALNTDYTLPLCTFSNGIKARINWKLVDGNTEIIRPSGVSIRITGDITIHANWGSSYDVSYIEPHDHYWKVELDYIDTSKATVRCVSTNGGVQCNEDQARSVQLLVNGKAGAFSKTYDGKPVTASVYKQKQGQYQEAFPSEDLITVSDVIYKDENGAVLSSPPVNAGVYTAQATVSPTNGNGNAENISQTIYIGKAQPSITVTGRELYSSQEWELVDQTDVTDMGHIFYRVNNGDWTTATPTASDPGEYTIEWYFVSGNYYGLHTERDPGVVHTTILQEHIHEGKAYLRWDKTDSLPTEGNYYLDNNIVLSKNAALGNVNICLNGKTIALYGHSLYIAEGTVNLFGHNGGGIVGGLKNRSTICIGSGAELITHGVSIETLYNYEDSYTFTYDQNNSYHTIETTETAGITVYGTLRMIGGRVIYSYGKNGGVFVGNYGSLELSGSPVIKGNHGVNGITEDVHLTTDSVVTVIGSLDEDADIGVYQPYLNTDPYTEYTVTSGFDAYCHGMDPATVFTIERLPSDLHYLSLNSDGEAAVSYHWHNYALRLTEGREDEVQFCCLNEDHCPLGGKVYTYRIHADDKATGDGIPTRAYFSGSLPNSGEIDGVSVIRDGTPKYRRADTGKLLAEPPVQEGDYTVSQNISFYYNGGWQKTVTITASYNIHTHERSSPVIENDIPSTCTEDGSYDEVTYCAICSAELRREHVTIPASHTFGEPQWSWSDNNRTAQAKFTCSICGHEETAEASVEGDVTDGKLIYTATVEMNGITYTDAKEIANAQHFDRVEPTVDSSGAYVLGTVEYYTVNGKNYAVNENGMPGEELSDLSISYFDFKENGDSWQILHYTGPYSELDVLEIPKTYQDKPITVIGDGAENAGIMNASGDKKQFILKLNENINEIKAYAFADTWITEVTGDTSALSVIGDHAFYDANSEGNYALTFALDYPGQITVGNGAFGNLNVTANIRHSTVFSTTDTGQDKITYVFTDAHTCGEPQWTWDDSYAAAEAVFTCTDARCGHTETIDATVTEEFTETAIIYTASVSFGGTNYTDTVSIGNDLTNYIDADGRVKYAQADYIASESTQLDAGWYAVGADLTVSGRISCSGDVHLILCDGCQLNAKSGISVNSGSSLTIYGQRGGTGTLIASSNRSYAGIGADSGRSSGNITINGGIIIASSEYNAAAIGGGNRYKGNSYITINGGTITATGLGMYAFGIGNSSGNSVITINGGTINAAGGTYAFDIGANYDAVITITGGVITANGNESKGGIGSIIGDIDTITLGWTNMTDSIYSKSYRGKVTFAKPFTDGTNVYPAGEVSDNSVLSEKNLVPYVGSHELSYVAADHGVVTGPDSARSEDTVTLNITPDDGYCISSVTVTDENDHEIPVTDGKFTMPDSDVTVYAQFTAVTPMQAPYIDDSGEYHLGNVAYAKINDSYYAVKDDGYVGEQLDSVALSYFDFALLEDGTYQIKHYTRPTGSDNVIDELVIPDTFEGKNITVLGTDDDSSSFVPDPVTIMLLKSGKNITEIKPQTFIGNMIYKVAGDTSNLRSIGDQAFGAILGVYEDDLDITLDYQGTIDNQGKAFGDNNVTIHLKHTTKFQSDLLTEGQITLDFTDDHTYGEPEWEWNEYLTSATAVFTCTDPRCKHEERVNATVSKSEEISKTVYSASVEFRGETYTGTKEIAKTLSDITIADCENGTVTAAKTSAYEGEEITLTVTPDTGYKLSSLTVKDESDNEVLFNGDHFTMPGSNVTVSAVFEQNTFAITYSVENGWVTGVYSADAGDEVELTITPWSGYELDTFSVTGADGNELTVTDDKFTMPDSDVNVSAVFKKSDIAVTYESDGNGTVTGPSTAQFNDEVPLTVTPDEGWALLSLYAEEPEWGDPVNVIDNTLYMIDLPVTVYAEFVPIIPAQAPYIDGSGEYHPGNIEYCEDNGYYYAVENGVVTKRLDSVEVNYFDFTDLGDSYQINWYTGPTEDLSELVIPKSYNGKPITVLGNDINVATNAKCRLVPQGTPGFTLVLNENITEIKPYSFYSVQITKVEGDTSSLSKIGNYAFSWANSGHGYTLDIRLDHIGKITTGASIFNHMNVTARIRHATTFNKSNFSQQSINYVFTDDHTYGEPEWTWADDFSTATAKFTCTDSRCKDEKTVNATVSTTEEISKTVYTATAENEGRIYTDTQEVAKPLYSVTSVQSEYGTVTADKSSAYAGEEVTLTVAPDEGCDLSSLSVKDENNGDITVTDNKFIMPAGKVTVTAVFTVRKYTVTWKNGDTVLETDENVPYGTAPTYDGETPAKAATAQYTYTFSGWSPELSAVTGDVTYTAVFTETVNRYTVKWKNGDTVLETDENVPYGTTPTYDGQTPIKSGTAQHNYTFTGWSPEISEVTGDITYTALFDEEVNKYTVTWENGDTVLETDEDVPYGTAPTYDGETPTKVSDDENHAYIFIGWSPEISEATCDVTYTAQFAQAARIAEIKPYIDENGAYVLGFKAHYETDGKYYSVNNDGTIGGEVTEERLKLSYFDFTLINNDTEYQINYYTGPTENLTKLEIPKTFNGKKITVLGNDNKDRLYEGTKTQFELVLNENIKEIKSYAFYVLYVTKVSGDTSGLNKIGDYAFSWANSPNGYTLDIKLDYTGNITVGSGIFNNMNVTARIKHATTFSRSSFMQKSISYIFTDAHTYGNPVWSWSEDNTSATATFTCTDSRCKDEKTVDATITSETKDGIITYTAAVQFDDHTYTDAKTAIEDGIGAQLVGHSISLDGDIAVNFYMELSDSVIAHKDSAYMHFTIPVGNGTTEQDMLVKDALVKEWNGKEYYVFKCRVAAKEMTSEIKAQMIDGDLAGTEYTYSVKEYADYLIEHADEREDLAAAVPLVKAMLNYGGYSQVYFDKNPGTLANAGLTDAEKALGDPEINIADPVISNLPEGVTFEGATLSLKSETTLSLYFKSSNTLEFSCDGYTVEKATSGGYQIARIRGIKAKNIGDVLTLKIDGSEAIFYSPLNYCKNVLDGGTDDENLIKVVKALYLYWQAADAYFQS